MNFENEDFDIPTHTPQSFVEGMRAMVERRIAHGAKGVNINGWRKDASKWPEIIVYRSHEMQPELLDLACELNRKGKLLDFRAWVHWMMDARLRTPGGDNVTIYHRSNFYLHHLRQHFEDLLNEHFGCKVAFKSSRAIRSVVEARGV